MSPETDRFQQTLALGARVALAMPVSLFEVPSMYDLPRRAQRKPKASHSKQPLPVERPIGERRKRA